MSTLMKKLGLSEYSPTNDEIERPTTAQTKKELMNMKVNDKKSNIIAFR